MSKPENPYSDSSPESTGTGLNKDARLEETTANLAFTCKLVRFSSIGLGIFTAIYGFTWAMGLYYLWPLELTWLHVIHVSRVLFLAAFFLFSWRSWLFASAIKNLPVNDSAPFANYVDNQTWVWLVILFLVFLLLAGTGLAFSASYAMSSSY